MRRVLLISLRSNPSGSKAPPIQTSMRSCSCNAQRIGPVGVGFGDGVDLDAMAPAIAEVVFVDELANGIAENGCECEFLRSVADLEAVQVRIGPTHHELQQIMQFWQCDRGGHEDPPPDCRLNILKFNIQSTPCARKTAANCRASTQIATNALHDRLATFHADGDDANSATPPQSRCICLL
jgi:hypothetical protein